MDVKTQHMHEVTEDQLGLPFDHIHEALVRLHDTGGPGQRVYEYLARHGYCTIAQLAKSTKVRRPELVVDQLNASDLAKAGLQIKSVPTSCGLPLLHIAQLDTAETQCGDV